jgi:hypothetical protein
MTLPLTNDQLNELGALASAADDSPSDGALRDSYYQYKMGFGRKRRDGPGPDRGSRHGLAARADIRQSDQLFGPDRAPAAANSSG